MSDAREKGAFQAEIPSDAVEEALRSVERVKRHGGEPGGEGEREVAVEVDGAPTSSDAADAGSPDLAALRAEVASLRAQLDLSQEKARETLEKLKEEHERRLRAAADLENQKKRAQREREDVQKFGIEKLVKDVLPVLDNLERALAAASADDPLSAGVKLVRASLEQVLGRHGAKGFSALGKPFDPALHEALMQVPTAEKPPGTVVLEHARGFLMHERLIRPAMVGVAVAPASAPGADGAAAGAGATASDEKPGD
jgi:molecular chaperone GrpE